MARFTKRKTYQCAIWHVQEVNTTKTLIAIPCCDTVPASFAESLLLMDKPQGTCVCFKQNSLIYDSRNLLSLTAIAQGFDNVLWLDSDILAPQDTITRMQEYFRNGYDMVSALYFKRMLPTAPVIYSELDEPASDDNGRFIKRIQHYTHYPQNAFFPVSGCGFGCVMTSTALLRKMWDKYSPPFTPYPWAGEDLSFCYRVIDSGIPIYCDSSIQCGHIGTAIFTSQQYLGKEGE